MLFTTFILLALVNTAILNKNSGNRKADRVGEKIKNLEIMKHLFIKKKIAFLIFVLTIYFINTSCSKSSNSDDNSSKNLTETLKSHSWKGNTCFGEEVGYDSNYSYSFNSNGSVTLTPADDTHFTNATFSVTNNNKISITFTEPGHGSCTDVWNVSSYNDSQIVLTNTVFDCDTEYQTSCNGTLNKP